MRRTEGERPGSLDCRYQHFLVLFCLTKIRSDPDSVVIEALRLLSMGVENYAQADVVPR